jgi:gas vesicle protein
MEENQRWKTKALLLGGLIGAILGMGTAYLLAQRAERQGETLKLGTGEGIRLGMLALGMLRQVANLGDKEK